MPLLDRNNTSIYRSIRRAVCLAAVTAAVLLGSGCQSFNGANKDATQSAQAKKQSADAFLLNSQRSSRWMSVADTEPEVDIWQRIRQGYQLQSYLEESPRTDHQRLWFASRGNSIEIMSERSSPYMYYIVENLEARNMPLELALLPMIESAYNPMAYSRSHASGLWQFIPSTGHHFKLKQSHWYDARRDIMASTQAALDYLEYLHKMFDNDWLLALAAYNAGEGTVGRAIKRNIARNLPTDYWNLHLPAETQAYVPKLLAVSQLINAPEAYGITLSPIANEAYFTKVPLKQQMEITRLAKLAKLDEDALIKLNPAYKQGITFDGPKHLLVPLENAEHLQAQLASIKPSDWIQWHQYKVRSGDNLSTIARRNQVPITLIKDINKLSSNRLQIGQILNMPKTRNSTANTVAPYTAAAVGTLYTVRAGDNLSKIAAQRKVSVAELKRWNKLSSNALKIGQKLSLTPRTGDRSVAATSKATVYKVRSGDSLYAIARRHKVSLKQLQNWNPSISSTLKPGQTLSLYL
ncbi:LysM peptidoglycan-binding domain-containing protein [Pseudomonas sp. C27(2019)]|uniref:LysM peptidoglycan-binding domain-containing protein n=1 Tax=Pseudomonas sp. C27(2019) TaxID=2604941 RepID=UPI001248AA33|nr:LysM peptidoglycan-binding domain-containing protein [Pseudomonas sp. C27(2019)]QEY58947.1 LysM peptidoglycan-binding domain-containing protein [Pseudomonas sp. C27(2019)]